MPPRRDPSEDGVLNPLSPGLAVLDARLPLLALALRALGILLLGARLAGVLTAHLATLHLFHGGHHVRVLGGLVRFRYLPTFFRKAMSDLPKRGHGDGGGEGRWTGRGTHRRANGRGEQATTICSISNLFYHSFSTTYSNFVSRLVWPQPLVAPRRSVDLGGPEGGA